MFHTGIVSVTFRNLSPQEVINVTASCGLDGIEWGGDIHVPHGDVPAAHEVRKMTTQAGLKVAAYGSYYFAGGSDGPPFEGVLESAVALGAPVIRIWAGKKGSADAGEDDRRAVVEDSQRIADQAASVGVDLAYEFHTNTLTDTADSALRLMENVDRDNVKTYWQALRSTTKQNIADIEAVSDKLVNIHAYHQDPDADGHPPLADGVAPWKQYLAVAAATGRDHYVLIEFVKDGAVENFRRDATTLKQWLANF